MLTQVGFTDVEIGPAVDTFGGARGEANARSFQVYGYAFVARKPEISRHRDRPHDEKATLT